MISAGYQWFCDHYGLTVFPLRKPAQTGQFLGLWMTAMHYAIEQACEEAQ